MSAAPDWPPARYLAWLYSTAQQRPLLHALFEIEREIAASVRPGLDHQVAHARLQWWRDECERCASGHARHPLTQALAEASGSGTRARLLEGLSGLVDTATWDLAGATFESRRELAAYCERWAAAMTQPIVLQADATRVDWRAAGVALRELELLTRVAQEAHAGRLRLPLDELHNAGAEPDALAHPPWPAAMADLLAARHTALRAELARAMGLIAPADQLRLRGLMVWAALCSKQSQQAQRALPEALQPQRVDALTATWHAWNAARRATNGRLSLE